MTPPPSPGGDPGDYEEKLVQWFLEHTFFLDFVYRNPRGKRGKGELADAVVLYDDVVLMAQIKAQFSARGPEQWAKGAIEDAVKQLRFTTRMLFGGIVRELTSATVGVVPFDSTACHARHGLIVLGQAGQPYDPGLLVPELTEFEFPVHVFSLADFSLITERFDTAGDFISYLDARSDLFDTAHLPVHAEAATLQAVCAHIEHLLRARRPNILQEVLVRSVEAFRAKASGALRLSEDWKYGLAIDDIIARVHERDVGLTWNTDLTHEPVILVAAELGWLTRDRRIALGSRLVRMCEDAKDGNDHHFSRYVRGRETAFLFLATGASRDERVKYLLALTLIVQAHYDAAKVVGIATEPIGVGRSYDAVMRIGRLGQGGREGILRSCPSDLRPHQATSGDDSPTADDSVKAGI